MSRYVEVAENKALNREYTESGNSDSLFFENLACGPGKAKALAPSSEARVCEYGVLGF